MYERGGDGGRLVPKRSEYCKIRFFWGGGGGGKVWVEDEGRGIRNKINVHCERKKGRL